MLNDRTFSIDEQFLLIREQKIKYEIYRQKRKTIAMSFSDEGTLIIKMPKSCKMDQVYKFMKLKQNWILEHYIRIMKRLEKRQIITEKQYKDYLKSAATILNEKVQYYSKIIGVSYNHVTIRNQKTRWGSCSSKGNINLNWKLILMPDEIQDYVIIHELCHLIEMNHSPRFWRHVHKFCNNYQNCRMWLRENAPEVEIRD